jgi:hypothetical protein
VVKLQTLGMDEFRAAGRRLAHARSRELNLVVACHGHLLREMDAYTLPGELEHQAQAGPEGALVLDVFQPVREDYRAAAE